VTPSGKARYSPGCAGHPPAAPSTLPPQVAVDEGDDDDDKEAAPWGLGWQCVLRAAWRRRRRRRGPLVAAAALLALGLVGAHYALPGALPSGPGLGWVQLPGVELRWRGPGAQSGRCAAPPLPR